MALVRVGFLILFFKAAGINRESPLLAIGIYSLFRHVAAMYQIYDEPVNRSLFTSNCCSTPHVTYKENILSKTDTGYIHKRRAALRIQLHGRGR